MVYTLRFFYTKCSLFHNSNVFGSYIFHILYTGCAKIKKKNNSGAKSYIPRYVVPGPLPTSNQKKNKDVLKLFYGRKLQFIFCLQVVRTAINSQTAATFGSNPSIRQYCHKGNKNLEVSNLSSVPVHSTQTGIISLEILNLLAPELFFFNFSTPCIQNVNNTGTKYGRIMKQSAF